MYNVGIIGLGQIAYHIIKILIEKLFGAILKHINI